MMSSKEAVTTDDQMTFSCHCGAIKVAVPMDPPPKRINECQCSNCRKRGAALVYYPLDQTTITKNGNTQKYLWGDMMCAYTWCETCGVLVYWYPTEKNVRAANVIGINSRCIDNPDHLKYVERHITFKNALATLEGVYDENGPVKVRLGAGDGR